jgi:CBS domain-containing protein
VVRTEDSVFEALKTMAERNVGALIVLEGDRVVGVISERDYARKVILIGKASRETLVREIMSSPAVTVNLSTTVSQCMELMTGRFIRHLPVVEAEILVGCVSIGDVVKTLIAEQGRRIGEFENYIRGSYPT